MLIGFISLGSMAICSLLQSLILTFPQSILPSLLLGYPVLSFFSHFQLWNDMDIFHFFLGSQFCLLLTALPSLSLDCIISDVPCRSLMSHHAFSSLCALSFIASLLKLKKPNQRDAKKLKIIASYYLFLFVFL